MFIINIPLCLFHINNIFKNEFDGLINEITDNDTNAFKEQYIISNIVDTVCLKVWYKGIVYKSTKDTDSINYALFNFQKDKHIQMKSIFTQ